MNHYCDGIPHKYEPQTSIDGFTYLECSNCGDVTTESRVKKHNDCAVDEILSYADKD